MAPDIEIEMPPRQHPDGNSNIRNDELIMTQNQLNFTENILESEKQDEIQNNACFIRLPKKKTLQKGIKENLKQSFECHWNEEKKMFSFPIKNKIIVEACLKNNEIEFILEYGCDEFFNLDPIQQKQARLESAKKIKEQKGLDRITYLQNLLSDYNSLYSENLGLKDLKEHSKYEFSQFEEQKKDHFEILCQEYQKIEDQIKDVIEIGDKIKDLNIDENEKCTPWSGIEIPERYELNNNGVWIVTKKENANAAKEDQKTTTKICDPVWVAGRSRDYAGSNSGLIIRWIDMDGITRETCIERRKLHATGNQIAEELAHNNLAIVPGKEKDLSKYLSFFTTNKTYRAVKSVGWLENPTCDLLYVSKKHTFKKNKINLQEDIIFQPDSISGSPAPLECRGTLDEWKENIAIPCRGNIVPIFLQSIALSGTVVKFSEIGSHGVHLSGLTSRGKTTAAQVAASTTGCGADPSHAPKLSIIKRWLSTANALESLASQSTDSVLILDEIGQCPGADLDKVIYNLFGGRGKERLTQNSQHRATRDWCTVVISTGERTLPERLSETNSKTPAGLFVRFIDIHVEEVFTDYHGISHKTFVDKLKKDCGLFYGTAAAAFIQKTIDTYSSSQELRENISIGCASIENEISGGIPLSQEHSRVLKIFCFAALAGMWASEWKIFPYTPEEVLLSARGLFTKWHNGNQKQTEDIRCICSIRDYFIKKRDSAFRPRYLQEKDKDIRRFGDIFGYTTNEGKFFLTDEGLNQALGGLSKKIAFKALLSRGYLLREESATRNNSKKTIDGIEGAPRVFVIAEKICEFDEESV